MIASRRFIAIGAGALLCAPSLRAQNALGVELVGHGKIAAAESAFVRAVATHAPDSLTAMANLASSISIAASATAR